MSYSYKCYSDTKDIMKKYVNAVEGAAIYGLGKTRIMALAKEAGAVYKVGNSALINTEIFESYLEKFREPSRPLDLIGKLLLMPLLLITLWDNGYLSFGQCSVRNSKPFVNRQ